MSPSLGHAVPMSDRFKLQRFVDAQDAMGVYGEAVRKLRNGQKQSH